MNSYSHLQYAEVNEVYKAWPVPEAEPVKTDEGSLLRPAILAAVLGLLFGVVAATVAGNYSAPTSAAVDSQDDSSAVVVKTPHHPREFQLISAPSVPVAETWRSRPAEPMKIRYFIEGDATVADFDSVSGTIQTEAGKTFLIGAAAAARVAGSMQDYHRNLHYRCDQSGNCTISGAGMVVPHAKLG
ncbi:MAG: hypothetical protein WCD70_05725 [Alphaproteobacteria bacterium]